MGKKNNKLFGVFCALAVSAIGATVLAFDGDNVQPWNRSADTHRNNLENSIAYIENMDMSGYTEESVYDLEDELENAKNIAAVSGSPAATYWGARNHLEYVRSCLVPSSAGMDGGSPVMFRELSKEELVDEMGTGINLGNTLDGHSSMTPGELVWQSVTTTKEIVRSMHDAGYNTLRVPVTWGNMIAFDEETGTYSINETWMNRVQEIVDYGVSQDMYIIINIHHDGVNWNNGWFNIGNNDIDHVMEKYQAVWKIIADRFKNYDEHLIFESMNEITCSVTEAGMWDGNGSNYDREILKSFNQLFVNTVRGTGGNNTKRWLASAGHFASSAKIDMPVDPCNPGTTHQIFAAHIYNSVSNLLSELDSMSENFNCAMYLGEWSTYLGTDGRTDSGYNDISIAYDSQRVNRQCKINGIVPIVWNCGMYTNDDGSLETGGSQYWNRRDKKPVFDNIIDGVMRGSYLDPYELSIESQYDSSITHTRNTDIQSIDCPSSVTLEVGDAWYVTADVSPKGTNDVLIWKSDDDSIATVSNGRIAAKKAGKTKVYVFAQNSVDYGYYRHYTDDPFAGAVMEEIDVTVGYNTSKHVTFSKMPEKLNTVMGGGTDIDYALTGAVSDYVNFYSDDESIATVNNYGHIFGKNLGNTTIHAETSSGDKKTIAVSVTEKPRDRFIRLVLVLYYNDSLHNFYSNEMGEPVKITGNGTYTVSFDVDENMSQAGIDNGITTINRVGSIYVKDYDVFKGNILDSNLSGVSLKWESIRINGTGIAIKDEYTKPFDPLKDGILDTGNPVNTWSGSIIDGVKLENEHEAVFEIDDPHTIEVTFTVSDIVWKAPEPTPEPSPAPGPAPAPSGGTADKGGQTATPVTDKASDVTDPDVKVQSIGKVKGIKIKKSAKSTTVSWKKIKGAKYQLAYGSVKKSVKKYKGTGKIKGVTVKTVKKNRFTIKKSGKKSKLYIKIRAFKNMNGKNVYGKWVIKHS